MTSFLVVVLFPGDPAQVAAGHCTTIFSKCMAHYHECFILDTRIDTFIYVISTVSSVSLQQFQVRYKLNNRALSVVGNINEYNDEASFIFW